MASLTTLIEKSKQAVRYWWLILLAGIVLFALGIWVLACPDTSFLSMAILFGWIMLVVGIFDVAVSASNNNFVTGRGWLLASGIIEIILGLILIFNVPLSAEILPLYLGFWLMFRGFTIIGLGSDMSSTGVSGAGWTIVCGILLILFSLWVILSPFLYGAEFVVVWVGITLLIAGIATAAFSFQLKGLHKKLSK